MGGYVVRLQMSRTRITRGKLCQYLHDVGGLGSGIQVQVVRGSSCRWKSKSRNYEIRSRSRSNSPLPSLYKYFYAPESIREAISKIVRGVLCTGLVQHSIRGAFIRIVNKNCALDPGMILPSHPNRSIWDVMLPSTYRQLRHCIRASTMRFEPLIDGQFL